jgi:hypothetical protein
LMLLTMVSVLTMQSFSQLLDTPVESKLGRLDLRIN